MVSTIYTVDADNRLSELRQTAYDSEALLQSLLADHPSLLGITGGEQGRLLLVRREMSVPDQEAGNGRWSLDHLFLDRDGVPVLVEVKRATDTRARREVVAQMLDYAANGVTYWPLEKIVAAFRASNPVTEGDPDSALSTFLEGSEPEAFWRQVEANLRAGRIRMVFVADRIAPELRRIVEFLNEQMRPAEVLAIEVEQFVANSGARTLVPKLVGNTERAKIAKAITPKQDISEDEWMEALASAHGQKARDLAQLTVGRLREAGFQVGITDSTDSISASVQLANGKRAWPFFLRRSSGKLETSLQYLKFSHGFTEDHARQALLDRLKALPGTFINTTKLTGWPAFPLTALAVPATFDGVMEIASEVYTKLTADNPAPEGMHEAEVALGLNSNGGGDIG